MLSVRKVLVAVVADYIVNQIAQPLGEKYSGVVVDKLQRYKEHNNYTDVEETEE